MNRTVYLIENKHLQATVEGPSILITKPGHAPQRIPIKFINKIYIIGKVNIRSDVIYKLSINNIPLILAERSGSERAVILPFNHKLPKFYREQKIILENQQNIKRYTNWIDAYRSYFQHQLIKRFLPKLRQKNGVGEGDYKILLKQLWPKNNLLVLPVKKTVTHLMRGLLIEKINKIGLDVHTGAYFRRLNFGFALDMGYLLEPKVDEQVILFFKKKNFYRFFVKTPHKYSNHNKFKLTKEGYRNIIHRFENLKDLLENQIDLILDDFFHLLRELKA